MTTIQDRFRLRRGTAANLAAVNEVPLDSEIVIESDTGTADGARKFKIGDGVTAWNALPYFTLVDTVIRCRLATAAALPANTYANGSSGVGATLTMTATGVLTVDGVATGLGDVLLVANEAAAANNGVYQVTTAGAVGVAAVLTRFARFVAPGAIPGRLLTVGPLGTANANTAWQSTTAAAPTVGATSITFARVGGLGGSQFAVAGGTANALTASFGIIPVLADGLQFSVRAAAANTAATPTFNPNGLGALTICKLGGGALLAGDIAGAGHELILRYRASPARYELLNPSVGSGGLLPAGGTIGQALLKASSSDGDAYWASLALAAQYTRLSATDKGANVQTLYSGKIAVGKAVNAGFARSEKPITGKKYFEAVFTKVTSTGAVIAAGVATSTASVTGALGYSTPDGWAVWGGNIGARSNGVTAVSASFASGDTVGFYVDEPGGKIWCAKNGVQLQGDPATGASPIWTGVTGTLYAAACPWDNTAQLQMRFSPDDWYYTPPAGYGAITA